MEDPGTEHQQSLMQTFDRLFPTEEACIGFLFPLRWPRGFVCPFCRSRHPNMAAQRYLLCPHCGNRSSLTTGTLMHGARKPLRDWLAAIWWFAASPFGASAKELQRMLGISCYQTAWTWLQKLRLAMAQADSAPCRGVVEIGCDHVAPAYERKEHALVLTAAEVAPSAGLTGRIHMRCIPALDGPSLALFLDASVWRNSTLLIGNDHLQSLLTAAASPFVVPAESDRPSRTRMLNRSVESYLHSVHRGGVTVRHLQLYLDEFCFRNNTLLLPDQVAAFKALLGGVFNGSIELYRHVAGLSAVAAEGRAS